MASFNGNQYTSLMLLNASFCRLKWTFQSDTTKDLSTLWGLMSNEELLSLIQNFVSITLEE